MRILLAGEWTVDVYEAALARALAYLGHGVTPFPWRRFHEGALKPAALSPGWVAAKFSFHYGLQPLLMRIGDAMVDLAARQQPDVVFIYRGIFIPPRTLRALRRAAPRAVIVGYNNDDAFAPGNPPWMWRHFIAALPHYDLALTFRALNISEFREAGAHRAGLLRGWFVPWVHRPLTLSPDDHARFECDVVFVGHFEPDGRLELLEAIDRAGYRLRLFGGNWAKAPNRAWLQRLGPIRPVFGDDYAKAIRGAKVALSFLSSRNRDTYTTRSFEIPAAGGVMLSQYTPDLVTFFREDIEAGFFRSRDEMLAKIARLCGDEENRVRIARAGRDRVIKDGHDVMSRAAELAATLAPLVARKHLAGRAAA